jgi:hypothetical protein
MKIGAKGCVRGRQRVFLDGVSTPSRLNMDAPTVTAMEAMDVTIAGGTCEMLKRWVSSINVGRVLIPFLLVRSYR